MFKLTLVRHGETNENKEGILQGHLDTKLSPLGVEQSLMVASRLRSEHFSHIYTSDLSRAKHTCQIIIENNKYSDVADIITDKSLRERDLGDFQGKPCKLFHQLNKENASITSEHKRWLSSIESIVQLRKRVAGFFTSLCDKIARTSGQDGGHPVIDGEYEANVLVVTHGGWLQELLRYFHKDQFSNLTAKEAMIRKNIPNTGVSIFLIDSTAVSNESPASSYSRRSSSVGSSLDSPTTPPGVVPPPPSQTDTSDTPPPVRYGVTSLLLHDPSHLVGECALAYFNYKPPA